MSNAAAVGHVLLLHLEGIPFNTLQLAPTCQVYQDVKTCTPDKSHPTPAHQGTAQGLTPCLCGWWAARTTASTSCTVSSPHWVLLLSSNLFIFFIICIFNLLFLVLLFFCK
jgi:hypothetical protein